MAGESVPSSPYFFVAFLNNDCNADSTILINVNIRSGENVYWYDDFVLNIEMLSTADGQEIPNEYALGGAYPNPFNASTTITFSVEMNGHAFLQIYDITGRLVATLVDEQLLPGEYEAAWDASKVSSGVYLVTLQIGTAVKSQKVVLLK